MSAQSILDAFEHCTMLASGLAANKIIWGFQNVNAPPDPYVEIHLGGIMTLGIDFIKMTILDNPDPGEELKLSVEGNREVPLEISVFTGDTATAASALFLCEKIRSGFLLPSIHTLLNAEGISAFDPGQVQYVPQVINTTFRGRAVATVRCYIPVPDIFELATYIESISGTITSSGGRSPTPDVRTFVVPE